MGLERDAGGAPLFDVLERILDKGVVVDTWVRVSPVGIDLVTLEARVVVASIETYLHYADAFSLSARASSTPYTPVHSD